MTPGAAATDLRPDLIAAMLGLLAISQITGLTAALLVAGAMLAGMLASLRARGMAPPWRRLLHVEGFVLLIFLTMPFTTPGTPLWQAGPLALSAEGLARAALVACKVSGSVLLLTWLLAGAEPAHLGTALHGLGLPSVLVRLFVTTARYLDVIGAEAMRLHEAMRARGFRPRSNPHTWRSYGNLTGMLLVRALDRAARVEAAMRCRGYSGQFLAPRHTPPDAATLARAALPAGLALGALLVDHYG